MITLLALLIVGAGDEITPDVMRVATREAEVIVTGTLTRIDPAKVPGEQTPGWKRATVVTTAVLKGNVAKGKAVTFIIMTSTDPAYDYAPKLKIGQKAVWLLTRGAGVMKDLTALDESAIRPLETEQAIRDLLAEAPCPAEKPSGSCTDFGAQCSYAKESCSCLPPCPRGIARPRDEVEPGWWRCAAHACSTALNGGKCAPDGLACPGCYGLDAFTCTKGKWVEHRMSPVP